MNWKAILKGAGLVALAPMIASFNNVLVSNSTGVHIPITVGTVLAPAIPIAAAKLFAYFMTAPKDQNNMLGK